MDRVVSSYERDLFTFDPWWVNELTTRFLTLTTNYLQRLFVCLFVECSLSLFFHTTTPFRWSRWPCNLMEKVTVEISIFSAFFILFCSVLFPFHNFIFIEGKTLRWYKNEIKINDLFSFNKSKYFVAISLMISSMFATAIILKQVSFILQHEWWHLRPSVNPWCYKS